MMIMHYALSPVKIKTKHTPKHKTQRKERYLLTWSDLDSVWKGARDLIHRTIMKSSLAVVSCGRGAKRLNVEFASIRWKNIFYLSSFAYMFFSSHFCTDIHFSFSSLPLLTFYFIPSKASASSLNRHCKSQVPRVTFLPLLSLASNSVYPDFYN